MYPPIQQCKTFLRLPALGCSVYKLLKRYKMVEFTDDNFKEQVEEFEGVAVVDFWAEWCGPCRLIAPILEELAQEYKDKKVKIGKFNIELHPETTMRYAIRSIPTVLFFKNGELKDKQIGTASKKVYKEKIDALLED